MMIRTIVSNTVRRTATPAVTCVRATSLSQRFYASGSGIHDNDPETLENEKQKNLKGEQHHTSAPHKHAPGWNEYLASTSEAFVKADQSPGPLDTQKLQNETVDYVNKRHPVQDAVNAAAEKVGHVVEEVKEASHEVKDTIMGPLAGASGKESKPGQDSAQDVTKQK